MLKSLGGKEMVKVPVMVHLELHYLYVKIYEGSTDSNEVIAYHKALNAITKMLNGKSM